MEGPSTSRSMKTYNMQNEMMSPSFNIFHDLQLAGALCDVELVASGVIFKAHKIILCGCSSYFRALFNGGWNVEGKHKYVIPGISSAAMGLVIEYAYRHSVVITGDNVESLLAAADQLDIQGIVQCCSDFLEGELCLENCISICSVADMYCCSKLHQFAYRFIMENFKEVAGTSDEFLELSLSQLCDMIEKDELNIRQEEVVFEAILRWIMHEPASRKAHISVLLAKVRMARMNIDYFMRAVKNNNLVKASEECRPIVRNALKIMFDLGINGQPCSDFHNLLTRPRLPPAILLATGGWSDNLANGIVAYDTRADCWVNVTQKIKCHLAYHGAVYMKGFVYVLGGDDGINCLDSVYRFNPFTQTWQEMAPMYLEHGYVSVAVLDGYIYALGGIDNYTCHKIAERYDPEDNSWSIIADMNEDRSDAGATALHGKVYICGGSNGIECLSSAECYDPLTNQWAPIAPMQNPRKGIGVIAYNEKIYAVGGSDNIISLCFVEAYDPVTDHWCAMAPMFSPRSNFGIGVVDDLLFVVGGLDGLGTTCKVEYYDGETGSWYRAQDMAVSRSSFSCCVVPAHPSIIQYAAPRESLMAHPEQRHPSASNALESR